MLGPSWSLPLEVVRDQQQDEATSPNYLTDTPLKVGVPYSVCVFMLVRCNSSSGDATASIRS